MDKCWIAGHEDLDADQLAGANVLERLKLVIELTVLHHRTCMVAENVVVFLVPIYEQHTQRCLRYAKHVRLANGVVYINMCVTMHLRV